MPSIASPATFARQIVIPIDYSCGEYTEALKVKTRLLRGGLHLVLFYSSPSRKWVELWQVQTVQRLWSWGRQGQNLRVEGATFDIPQDGFLAVVCMNVSDGQTGDHVIIVEANFQTGGSRDLGRFHLPDGVRFDGCADICGDLVACVLLRDRETLVLLANWCAGKFLVFGAWALYETPFALFPGHIILGFSHMPSSAIDHLNVYPVPSLDSLWRSASVFDLEDTIDASRIDASSLNLSIINNPTPRPFPESHHVTISVTESPVNSREYDIAVRVTDPYWTPFLTSLSTRLIHNEWGSPFNDSISILCGHSRWFKTYKIRPKEDCEAYGPPTTESSVA
ncbi:hypothetical protein B0H11DRAFT_2294907 [Mycena galericulata]|nr:hypothetical protein B0H11DRAFT_2294907 [Mycena galericulata]